MLTYDEAIRTLSSIYDWCNKGKSFTLSTKELEAISMGILAMQTLADMPVLYSTIIDTKENEQR